MIFNYNIILPLTYNMFEIQSNVPDSELRYEISELCEEEFKIIFRTYEIPGCVNGYDFENVIKVKLYTNSFDNTEKLSLKNKDNCRITCEIEGMLVDDEIYAKKFSEEIVDRLCKRLSILFIKHNANRHLYQPRVEPIWSEAEFKCCKYTPFVEAKRKILEETSGNSTTIYLEDCINIHDSMYCISQISISSAEINIKEWLSKKDDVVEFLMNEFYSALGTENIKSKFFHLFSIIEFCENEYKEHNGSNRILSDDETSMIIDMVKEQINPSEKTKIVSILKNNLIKASDIGRIKKLKNILKWMGIERYNRFGHNDPIDENLLSNIIKLRNKSFHGTKENASYANKEYAKAVELLLYIGEKILEFLLNNPNQNERNDILLIYGKK